MYCTGGLLIPLNLPLLKTHFGIVPTLWLKVKGRLSFAARCVVLTQPLPLAVW